jgi:hypothetical protein
MPDIAGLLLLWQEASLFLLCFEEWHRVGPTIGFDNDCTVSHTRMCSSCAQNPILIYSLRRTDQI